MRKHGDKLKNETSQAKAMRAKFRTGKADTSVTKAEAKKTAKLHAQGRKAAYKNAVLSGEVRRKFAEANEDESAGADAVNAGETIVEGGYYSIRAKAAEAKKKAGYSQNLHASSQTKKAKGEVVAKSETPTKHEAQKTLMKKEIQREAFRDRAVDTAHSAGSISKRFVDKAEDMAGKLAEAIAEFFEEHPLGLIIAGVLLLLIFMIAGGLSSCAMFAGGGQNVVISTSYTAEDADIVAVEGDYKAKEEALLTEINNIERDYPGYDEYQYDLADIEHDPFELASLLTVLYEDYTEAEVQSMLETIFDAQYTLTKTPETEICTRTENRWHYVTYYREEERTGYRMVNGHLEEYTYTVQVPYEVYESYEVEVEYEYHILKTTLTNGGISAAVSAAGLTDEQMERYGIILSLKGNKPEIFD